MNAEQKKLPFEPILDILNSGPDEEKGGKNDAAGSKPAGAHN